MTECQTFDLPGFVTQGGVSFNARLAYRTYGELNAARDNAVVVPTFYGGRHDDTAYLFGDGRAIDTRKYFVVVPNMFGNGLSSSPSNTPAPYGRGAFPLFTLYDNVHAQYRLLTEALKVARVRLVTGFSMGGQQAYQWGVSYPDYVDAIAPICASARISEHNHLFVDSACAALRLDPDFKDGWYDGQPVRGVLAFGKVYAAWLFSQDFMREQAYRQIGLNSKADVVRFTQSYFLQNDANDLLAMASTWLHADVSANPEHRGDFEAALAGATPRAIVMPGETDLYFRVADSAREVPLMPNAELRVIPSIWGHAAGFGMAPADSAFVDRALTELLA
jgi:homoserine O-acetyltransferase